MDAARLMYNNARLRLLMPEAYKVHQRVINWGKVTSESGRARPGAGRRQR